jgi:hypothetical protein
VVVESFALNFGGNLEGSLGRGDFWVIGWSGLFRHTTQQLKVNGPLTDFMVITDIIE